MVLYSFFSTKILIKFFTMNRKLILSIALIGLFGNINAQEETTIQEVTIASKVNQKINKTGRNTTLITAQDLEHYKGKTLSEVLNQASGIHISNNFSNNAEPKTSRIRGGNNANVVILIDGVPLQDVTTINGSLTDIRLLALDNIESIEILNGASSVLYGANATTAVIDIKTKKHSQKTIEAIAGVRVGSYDTFAQKLNVSGQSGVLNYLISGLNEKSNGISAAYGDNFQKDGFEKQNINAKFNVDLGKFNFNILGGWNHHLYQYDADAFTDGQNRGNDSQHYVGFGANYLYNIGKITFNTRYSENERILESFSNNQYNETGSYNGANSFTEIYNDINLGQYFGITAGLQYEDHRMDYSSSWGGGLNKENTRLSHFDIFANARFNYQFFNIEGGTRMVEHSQFGNHWVYHINPYFYQEMGEWFGKAGYSHGTAFIAPSLYQIYGDGSWTNPNFDLEPEKNRSQEINLSFGKRDRSFVANASLFHRKDKNAIIYGAGSYTNADAENSTRGFEAGFDYQITSFLRFGGNFSFVEKKNEDANTMARQPKQRANSYLEIAPFKKTNILISHTYVGKRHDFFFDSNWTRQNVIAGDFNLFNITINQRINKNLSAYFHLNNIFNKHYFDVMGYTAKNRNFTLGVDYKF